jgi:hypothetical protein
MLRAFTDRPIAEQVTMWEAVAGGFASATCVGIDREALRAVSPHAGVNHLIWM